MQKKILFGLTIFLLYIKSFSSSTYAADPLCGITPTNTFNKLDSTISFTLGGSYILKKNYDYNISFGIGSADIRGNSVGTTDNNGLLNIVIDTSNKKVNNEYYVLFFSELEKTNENFYVRIYRGWDRGCVENIIFKNKQSISCDEFTIIHPNNQNKYDPGDIVSFKGKASGGYNGMAINMTLRNPMDNIEYDGNCNLSLNDGEFSGTIQIPSKATTRGIWSLKANVCGKSDNFCGDIIFVSLLPGQTPVPPRTGSTSTNVCGGASGDPNDSNSPIAKCLDCLKCEDPTDPSSCDNLGSKSWTALGCVSTDPEGFVGQILPGAIGVGGGIAFLIMLWGIFTIIMSSGNPEKLNQGKEMIVSAIAGLLMILFSIFLLRVIGVDILGIPGIK